MDAPATLYLIASTMRTGSYLLCEGLEATGRAGHPCEAFCPERREDYCGQWHLPANIPFSKYLRTALEKGTTENGVCGMKIHWHHVEPLSMIRGGVGKPWRILQQLFPTAKYVHLRRRDIRAQAISWFRAKVTNQWWQIQGEEGPPRTGLEPVLDVPEIRRMELELERQENCWREFFTTQPVVSMAMDYEALEANYRDEVARVLEFIGEDAALAKGIPAPRLVRQRDAQSEEWQRRMEEEFPTGKKIS
jgi:LPS sulfotransferase NodH